MRIPRVKRRASEVPIADINKWLRATLNDFANAAATRIEATGEVNRAQYGGASLPGVRRACAIASLDHQQQDLARHRERHEHADPWN